MIGRMLRTLSLATILLGSMLMLQQTVLAGPPLICHPLEIDNAKSLPWSGAQWRDVDRKYDLNRLVEDTLAILRPETPVIVRMETLRRATVYSMWSKYDREVGYKVKNDKVADELMARLMQRVQDAVRNNQSPGLALFDAGYLKECYNQASYHSGNAQVSGYAMVKKSLDGYTMVRKSSGFGGRNPEIEFAAALMTQHPVQPTHREHLQRAIAGAKEGSLLARNLIKHFGQRGQNLTALKAQLVGRN